MEQKILAFLIIIFSVNAMLYGVGLLSPSTAEQYFIGLPEDFNSEIGFGSGSMDFNSGDAMLQRTDEEEIPFVSGFLQENTPLGSVFDLFGNLIFGYFKAVDRIVYPLDTVENTFGEDCSNEIDDNGNGQINEFCEQAAMNSFIKLMLAPIGIIQTIAMCYFILRLIGTILGAFI